MRETWKKIPDFPAYSISDLGRVRRDVKGRTIGEAGDALNTWLHGNGYPVVGLYARGKMHKRYVHRLVAIAFLGAPPKDTVVAHWDGDKTNNNLSNLRWATQKENAADKRHHGSDNYSPKGSRTFGPKLTEWIQSEVTGGRSMGSIARQMQVSWYSIRTAVQHGSAPRHCRVCAKSLR